MHNTNGPPQKWVQTTVLTERWRLVEGTELYDINADPGQTKDVHAEHLDIVAWLTKRYDELCSERRRRFH